MLLTFRSLTALLKSPSGRHDDITRNLDDMVGSTCFFTIDLISGFLRLEIHKDDRHLTAFRSADGKLWEYVRCGFRLKSVPSAFANYLGGWLTSVNPKGVKNCLTDIAMPSKSIATHWPLLSKTHTCLRERKLTVNLQKSRFYPTMEFAGIFVVRVGARPAPSKIDANDPVVPTGRGGGHAGASSYPATRWPSLPSPARPTIQKQKG